MGILAKRGAAGQCRAGAAPTAFSVWWGMEGWGAGRDGVRRQLRNGAVPGQEALPRSRPVRPGSVPGTGDPAPAREPLRGAVPAMRAVLRRGRLLGPGGVPRGPTAAPPLAVDLRSDTVTRPCAAMRRAMARAAVGDDDYGEDPAVNGGRRGRAPAGSLPAGPRRGGSEMGGPSGPAGVGGSCGVPKPLAPQRQPSAHPCSPSELQRRAAAILGTESALFVPTATMANLIAGESGLRSQPLVPPGCGMLPLAPSFTALLSQ